MNDKCFPKLNQLTSNYFKIDNHLIDGGQIKKKFLADIEMKLQQLDNDAWLIVKGKLNERQDITNRVRPWGHLHDTLNELNGFIYLIFLGCKNIEFIHETDTKTPDLKGSLGKRDVFCEVKTVSISEIEAIRRRVDPIEAKSVRTLRISLPVQFFDKIRAKIKYAITQIDTYSSNKNSLKIIYIFINFDDNLGEISNSHYLSQIEEFKDTEKKYYENCEIIFEWYPPFYFARV